MHWVLGESEAADLLSGRAHRIIAERDPMSLDYALSLR
jgi:hypothetical protein